MENPLIEEIAGKELTIRKGRGIIDAITRYLQTKDPEKYKKISQETRLHIYALADDICKSPDFVVQKQDGNGCAIVYTGERVIISASPKKIPPLYEIKTGEDSNGNTLEKFYSQNKPTGLVKKRTPKGNDSYAYYSPTGKRTLLPGERI